jgi:thiol-disulfide isomerase/thioredoxin
MRTSLSPDDEPLTLVVVWLRQAYSPACPHCRAFAPTLDELSIRFKDVPSVTIAIMNCDTNTPRAPGHRNEEVLDEIDRVPTLILYPANPGKGGPEWLFGEHVVGGPPLSSPILISARRHLPSNPSSYSSISAGCSLHAAKRANTKRERRHTLPTHTTDQRV